MCRAGSLSRCSFESRTTPYCPTPVTAACAFESLGGRHDGVSGRVNGPKPRSARHTPRLIQDGKQVVLKLAIHICKLLGAVRLDHTGCRKSGRQRCWMWSSLLLSFLLPKMPVIHTKGYGRVRAHRPDSVADVDKKPLVQLVQPRPTFLWSQMAGQTKGPRWHLRITDTPRGRT